MSRRLLPFSLSCLLRWEIARLGARRRWGFIPDPHPFTLPPFQVLPRVLLVERFLRSLPSAARQEVFLRPSLLRVSLPRPGLQCPL